MKKLLLVTIIALFCTGCYKDNGSTIAIAHSEVTFQINLNAVLEDTSLGVITKIEDITANSARCHGTITVTGNTDNVLYGICWSDSSNPTYNDFHNEFHDISSSEENFSFLMTNLKPDTEYHVKVYIKKESSISYSQDSTVFSTLKSN